MVPVPDSELIELEIEARNGPYKQDRVSKPYEHVFIKRSMFFVKISCDIPKLVDEYKNFMKPYWPVQASYWQDHSSIDTARCLHIGRRSHMEQVGITGENMGLHALRATATTSALEHNGDIAKVQEWLGHTNISTTRILNDGGLNQRIRQPFELCIDSPSFNKAKTQSKLTLFFEQRFKFEFCLKCDML